ncbi:hypothetical protein ACFQ08_29215, partial [Streptosporangium algeriense]
PRRVRQANLSPGLRQDDQRRENDQTSGVTERSPEEARALLNSFQSGWRRGRAESEDGGAE